MNVLAGKTELNRLSSTIIGAAIKVHKSLGPGLLESTYETCLDYELRQKGCRVERQKKLPVTYENVEIEAGYRIDLLVEEQVIVEIKAVEALAPIHEAQVLTYLKLSGLRLGLLLNFNEMSLKKGIRRLML